MPINYYCGISMNGSNIDMNKNQLITPVIETGTTNPAVGTNPVVGQMFYNTTDNIMYFYNGTAWITMDGSGSGVESITIAAAGVNATDIDTSLVLSASAGTITLQPMQFGGSAKIGMVPDASGGTDSVKFLKGDGTWETPIGAYTSWSLEGDTGTAIDITDGDRVDFTGGKGISTVVASATPNTLTITLDVASLTAGTAIKTDFLAFSDESVAGAVTKKMTIEGVLGLGGFLEGVVAGDGLIETNGGTQNPTISVDYVGTDNVILEAASAPSAKWVVAADTVMVNDATDDDVKQALISDLPFDQYTSWTLSGDTGGVNQAITTGQTANFIGYAQDDALAGITTLAANTDTLKIQLDLSKLETATALDDPSTDYIVYWDENSDKNQVIPAEDIHLNDWGDAVADVDFGGFKLLDVADGSAATDGVNLGQVETLVAGQSLFKGAYDASTEPGSPAISGASNIANSVGDFYAVTVGGAFFTFTLEPGDLIFINNDIAANTNPAVSAFTVVQSGQNIATAAATDGAAIKGVAGFDSATFTVSATGWVQSVVYSGTTNIGVVPSGGGSTTFLRGDGTWVVPTNSGGTITSVVASTSTEKLGISVTTASTTATVGLDIDSLTAYSSVDSADELVTYSINDDENKKVTVQNLTNAHQTATTYKQTLSAFTTGTTVGDNAVVHGLSSFDVMVQLYNENDKTTIEACVDRTTVDYLTISGNSYPAGNITVLVTKIG